MAFEDFDRAVASINEPNELIAFETAVANYVNKVGPATPTGWITTTGQLEAIVKDLAFVLVECGKEDYLRHLTTYLNKRSI